MLLFDNISKRRELGIELCQATKISREAKLSSPIYHPKSGRNDYDSHEK
jgi:hypothetical protein